MKSYVLYFEGSMSIGFQATDNDHALELTKIFQKERDDAIASLWEHTTHFEVHFDSEYKEVEDI